MGKQLKAKSIKPPSIEAKMIMNSKEKDERYK